jgi:glutaminyl-tRNA synthetase
MSFDKENATKHFEKSGLDKKNIENLLKNESLSKTLVHLIDTCGAKDISKCGHLLFTLVGKCKTDSHRAFISKYIGSEKITTPLQLDEAVAFVKPLLMDAVIDVTKFEDATGIGAVVTEDDIKKAAKSVIDDFVKNGKKLSYGDVMGSVKRIGKIRFGDGAIIKKTVDEAIASAPKIEEIKVVVEKKTEKKEEEGVSRTYEAREIEDAKNPEDLKEKHLKETGGQFITRFPPEPNGFLHIGHAKAMNLSFSVAKDNGYTILRYDDTNPEVEEDIYYKSIKEMVEWMGFKPAKITYTSNYFQEMFDFAVKMIKDGFAYCDPSTPDEMKDQREKKIDSPYREKHTVEENLKIFYDMKNGVYEEGKMCLRCKMYNPHLRDFVCYRIKYHSHPNTGDKWCVYPSYDFSHCIVDSLENITHSLCTLEFETRRDSYYWVLKTLNLYRPHVWEFSRLNITKNVLSKRRLLTLVKGNLVRGWDDPRLLTLVGLRRRGFTPESIRNFCDDVGVTRVDNTIAIERLEQSCRDDLDKRCDRAFGILHPIKVILTNLESEVDVHADNHPKDKERGTRVIKLTKEIFIEADDFRLVDDKDYFGLAPGKEVGLRFGPHITCTDFVKTGDKVTEIRATVDLEKKVKPKGHIHWLPARDAIPCEVRLYKPLFTIENIGEEGDGWEKFIDKTSEETLTGCYADPLFANAEKRKPFAHYQFERVGFFVIDPDTTKDHLVFNRTVTLKESKTKK